MSKNFLGKKVWRMGQYAEKRHDRKNNGVRQNNKRGGCKVESNDNPIASRQGEDIGHPRSPFGGPHVPRFVGQHEYT